MLVANKTDTSEREHQSGEFYKLGMGDVSCISSVTGRGTGEFLDRIVSGLGDKPMENNTGIPKLAIVGRPNAGKSSLLNALLGEERAIVTPVAGTTRDALHTHYKKYDHEFILIDTAGIRKKRKYEEVVEFYSNLRAIRAIEECDVCLIMLDAQLGMEAQDVNIFRLAERNKKGVVILVNKWDLREGDSQARQEVEHELRRRFPFLTWAPVLFASAANPDSLGQLLPTIDRVFAAFSKRIPTGALNKFLQEILATHPLPVRKGKPTKITKSAFMTQVATQPPVFALFVGHPDNITPAYLRFLENQLREHYGFEGTPIRMLVRKK